MCSNCHRRLARADFPANSSKRDGLYSWCRDCVSERNKGSYVNRHVRTEAPRGPKPRPKVSHCQRCGITDENRSWGKGVRCPKCKEEVSVEKAEVRRQRVNDKSRRRSREIKAEIAKGMGGECQNCGYNRYASALEFHHLGNKEGNVSTMISNASRSTGPIPEALIEEAAKCVLLCSNCHQALHASEWSFT